LIVAEPSILDLKDVSLKLGKRRVLNHLSMEFWQGYAHAVIGPNGAGKSTLASTIMGLSDYRNHSGDILFESESVNGLEVDERARKGISLAWQEPARYEGLGVKQFISAGADDKSESKIAEMLELVGLDPGEYMKRAVDKTLSGGERKRIELASIMAMKPKLVILDEPDSGIDVEALNRIFDAIKILKENGSTVLLITHSLAVLEQADHAFLMCCGKIVEKGSLDKIRAYFGDKCIPCDHKNEPEEEEFDGE
jgi:Fe-S cluster assembly ATP-binding protein